MARRESALKGVSWVVLLAVVGGFGWFGLRAFRSISARMAADREHAAEVERALAGDEPTGVAQPVFAADAGSARESARAECRAAMDAVDTNFNLKSAADLCRKRLAEFGGDPELAKLTREIQCREWRDQVAGGSKLAKELNGWIAKDCVGPDGEDIPAKFISLDQLKCRKFTVELDDLRDNNPHAAWWKLDVGGYDKCAIDVNAVRAELKPKVIAQTKTHCLSARMDFAPGAFEVLDSANGILRDKLDSCKRYAALSYCPELKELKVPTGKKVVLKGKLGANGWRPKDPVLVQLLQNQFLGVPVEGEWKCEKSMVDFWPTYDDPGAPPPRRIQKRP